MKTVTGFIKINDPKSWKIAFHNRALTCKTFFFMIAFKKDYHHFFRDKIDVRALLRYRKATKSQMLNQLLDA